MGLYTKIIEKDGSVTTINTEDYVIGTYVIINNDPGKQFCVDMSEKEYHKKMREYAIKNENQFGKTEGWLILEAKDDSSIIVSHNAKDKEDNVIEKSSMKNFGEKMFLENNISSPSEIYKYSRKMHEKYLEHLVN